MMATILDVLLSLASAHGLTHFIFYNTGTAVNPDPTRSDVRYVDLPCDAFTTDWHPRTSSGGLGNPPVINVIIDCPRSGQGQENTTWRVLERSESTLDPLSNPMVNLIVTGSWADVMIATQWVGQTAMIKDVYRLVPSTTTSHTQGYTMQTYDGRVVWSSAREHHGLASRLSEHFTGFDGRQFRVANEEAIFFTVATGSGENKKYSGYTIEVCDELAMRLNFTYRIVQSPSNSWGAKLDNGTWVGMVGLMVTKSADMIISSLTVTSLREEVVDFTIPFWEDFQAVAITYPGFTKISYIFHSLSWQVWVIACFTIVLYALVLYCIQDTHLSCSSKRSSRRERLDYFLLAAFGLLFGQGTRIPGTELMSRRIMDAGIMVMMIVVYSTYSSNLMATLATTQVELPFATLQGLVDDPLYQLYTTYGNVQHNVLKEAKSGVLSRLYKRLNGYPTYNEILGAMKDNNKPIAYIGDYSDVGLTFRASGVCKTHILPETFYPSGHAVALPEGSPFLPYFTKMIIRFNDEGLLKKWKKKHETESLCHQSIGQEEPPAISMSKVIGAFLALIGGVLISVIVFIGEKVLFKKSWKKYQAKYKCS